MHGEEFLLSFFRFSSREVKVWNLSAEESYILTPSNATQQVSLEANEGMTSYQLSLLDCTASATVAAYSTSTRTVLDLWWINSNYGYTKPHASITEDKPVKQLQLENTFLITSDGHDKLKVYDVNLNGKCYPMNYFSAICLNYHYFHKYSLLDFEFQMI